MSRRKRNKYDPDFVTALLVITFLALAMLPFLYVIAASH